MDKNIKNQVTKTSQEAILLTLEEQKLHEDKENHQESSNKY